jgi:hypothetical protein
MGMIFLIVYPCRISAGHLNSSPKQGPPVVMVESEAQTRVLQLAREVDKAAIVVPAAPPDLKMFPVSNTIYGK